MLGVRGSFVFKYLLQELEANGSIELERKKCFYVLPYFIWIVVGSRRVLPCSVFPHLNMYIIFFLASILSFYYQRFELLMCTTHTHTPAHTISYAHPANAKGVRIVTGSQPYIGLIGFLSSHSSIIGIEHTVPLSFLCFSKASLYLRNTKLRVTHWLDSDFTLNNLICVQWKLSNYNYCDLVYSKLVFVFHL